MLRHSLIGLSFAAIALPLLAADSLQVKTGLWETTIVSNATGMSMPPEQLSKMPPAQRAQMEQMMKQMSARGPRTHKEKSCITEKDLKEGAFRGADDNDKEHCKYTQVSSTPRHQEVTYACSGGGHSGNGRMVIDAADSTHVQGTIDFKSDSATINMKLTGVWLSASCAGADKD